MPTDIEAADAFERLQSAASDGPWERVAGGRLITNTQHAIVSGASPKDANLICASRTTDLPDRIRRLVAENERLKAATEILNTLAKRPEDFDGDPEEAAFRSGIRHAASILRNTILVVTETP